MFSLHTHASICHLKQLLSSTTSSAAVWYWPNVAWLNQFSIHTTTYAMCKKYDAFQFTRQHMRCARNIIKAALVICIASAFRQHLIATQCKWLIHQWPCNCTMLNSYITLQHLQPMSQSWVGIGWMLATSGRFQSSSNEVRQRNQCDEVRPRDQSNEMRPRNQGPVSI